MSRIIVAFTGLAGAGKSTAALRLVDRHGYTRVKFADPLKAMLRAGLLMNDDEIEGALKQLPCKKLCGKTPRFGMQSIGTEWGRVLIGEDIWVNAWRAMVDDLPEVIPVVVDDCRFPNEAEAIRAACGHIVHIERVGAGADGDAAKHSSETQELPCDCTIVNDGDIDALNIATDAIHADLTWAHAA